MHYFEERMLPEERGSLPYLPTFQAFLDYISDRYSEKTALSDPEKEISYTALREHVEKRRGLLKELRIPAGSNIGLMGKNSIEAVEWFLAVTTYGCTAVMMPATLQHEILPGVLSFYEIRLLVHDGAAGDTSSLPVPVVSVTDKGTESAPCAQGSAKDRAAIFFTGGTTGKPKGVILSHGALMRGALNGTYRPGTIYGQVMVAVLPFIHVFGMIFSLLSGLYTGSHVGVCAEAQNLFREMQRVKPTTMIAVPGMAELMLMMARSRGAGILGGNLKMIICGAAPVPERLHNGFLPLGVEVLAGYGMTETANLVSGNLDMERYPDSVGRQYPEQRSRIVDGELQVQGDMLFDGYWKDEAATQAAFTADGWLRTGDLARFDPDGFLYIVGRIKNLIILDNGENVSPEELEAYYYRCSMIRDCLVSETVINGKAAILLEVQPQPGTDDEALLEELQAMTSRLPAPMRPARTDLHHEDFEKSPSMKIIRKGAK